MNRVFLLVLLSFVITFSNGQKLSNKAEISLLTCDPGEELYSLFGHSAIRVEDKQVGIDLVFNYGTFDFNTPNFYLKFAQGRLDYLLSVSEYNDFLRSYQREKRSVYSQKILLDSIERQRLFDALRLNYQPENRAYKYDFFMDNCATRIDNIFHNELGGIWKQPNKHKHNTYREGLAPYLVNSDWLNLGLNIILGAPTDGKQQGLFLPDIMKDEYRQTTRNQKPFVASVRTLYDAKYSYTKTPFFLRPSFILYSVAIVLLLLSLFFPTYLRWIDFLLFTTVGTIGGIISFLWFFADHIATNQNWNILWAFPTHLIIAFYILFQKKKSKFLRIYFTLTFILLSGLVVFTVYPRLFNLFEYTPKAFPFMFLLPILLLLMFRTIGNIYKNN